MPKKAWNISNFSEGMNLKRTSKDIDPKGFEYATGYMALNEGSVSTKGVFDEIPNLTHDIGAFQGNYSFQGTANLYKVFPEIGFRRFGRAKYEATGSYWKEQRGANDFLAVHGLDVGTKLIVIQSDAEMTYRINIEFVGQVLYVMNLKPHRLKQV